MKVVIGSEVYDGSKMRVAVILEAADRHNIAAMPEGAKVYAVCPAESDPQAFALWVVSVRDRERA